MMALLKNEVYKIFKLKKLYIFMGIIALLNILQFALSLVARAFQEVQNDPQMQALSSYTGQNYPLAMLDGLSSILIIFMAIYLADVVTDEYRSGTLKLSLIRPVSRLKVIASKAGGLFISLLSLLLFTMVISYLLGTAFYGWGDAFTLKMATFERGSMGLAQYEFSTIKGILFTLFSYVISVLPFMAFGMIVFLLAVLFSNMGATIAASLGIWIGLDIARAAVEQIRPYLVNNYYTLYSYFLGDINWGNIIIAIAVMIAYGVAFFSVGYLIFRKKDILM